jgi:DNA-binding XRE family transcriptional regulator
MDNRNGKIGGTGYLRRELGGMGENLPCSMDPNYSTGTRPYPWDRPAPVPSNRPSRPSMVSIDSAWVQQLRNEQGTQFKAEVLRRLQLMPGGQRIRNLRAVLGWTQRTAAAQLGISVRTLIRHEQGHHRTRWLRYPLLLRLRELESTYVEQIIAHPSRIGSAHT